GPYASSSREAACAAPIAVCASKPLCRSTRASNSRLARSFSTTKALGCELEVSDINSDSSSGARVYNQPMPKRIAILGAGPIGIEAALYARSLGHTVTLYEQGPLAANVGDWGHVRLFTPWRM